MQKHMIVIAAIMFSTTCAWAQSTMSAPELPKEIADREGFYPAINAKKDTPVVIYILEAHTNYEVQKSIVSILQYLSKKLDSRLILVEGGVGDVSVSVYRVLGDKEKRREVAEQFLKEGKFSAEEYLDLAEDLPLSLYGVENPALYDENLIAFLRADTHKEKTSRFIQATQKTVLDLRSSIYAPDFVTYLKKQEALTSKDSSRLLEKYVHLGQTAKQRNISLAKAPLFERFLGMVEEENNFDFSSISYERDQLIRHLSKKVLHRDLRPYIDDWNKAQTDQGELKAYLDRLVTFATQNGIAESELKKFKDYRNYLDRANSLLSDKMMSEIEDVQKQVDRSFLQNDDQKKLYQISQDLILLDKLFRLEMTPEEFQEYKKRKADLSSGEWLKFLKLTDSPDALNAWMSDFEAFFKAASLRDQAMSENIYTKVISENQPVSVLIAGGFHKERLIKKMNRLGLSVLVLMPHFSEETDQARYHELLKSKWEMRNW